MTLYESKENAVESVSRKEKKVKELQGEVEEIKKT
eukprot:CAMPEP_0202979690 /NCGR_PEP_ID=MMETSP1396-20130829/85771_1 /ASSEMBLY_ACC=CAM_ASM_000872 /TAXON_ID= /ORGANISM="Pseudokeronopsis sp., Strain Brazil" /LENGTH=34 /DNA_ID= /DNA_START= /DNA_END= /DNA_ORIENTATION=